MLMMMESGTRFGAISVWLQGNLRTNNVKRVPVGAMPESFGGEYCCLFGDRLWDDHIAVLLIQKLGHLIRKPQKSICIILAPTVALVQQITLM
nr:isoform 2 of endoribonuclease dicer like 4 [Quercus suber]